MLRISGRHQSCLVTLVVVVNTGGTVPIGNTCRTCWVTLLKLWRGNRYTTTSSANTREATISLLIRCPISCLQHDMSTHQSSRVLYGFQSQAGWQNPMFRLSHPGQQVNTAGTKRWVADTGNMPVPTRCSVTCNAVVLQDGARPACSRHTLWVHHTIWLLKLPRFCVLPHKMLWQRQLQGPCFDLVDTPEGFCGRHPQVAGTHGHRSGENF